MTQLLIPETVPYLKVPKAAEEIFGPMDSVMSAHLNAGLRLLDLSELLDIADNVASVYDELPHLRKRLRDLQAKDPAPGEFGYQSSIPGTEYR